MGSTPDEGSSVDGEEQLNDELDGFLSAIKTKLKKFACGSSSLSPTTSPLESADFFGRTALNSSTTKLRNVKVMPAEEDSDVYNFDYPKRGLAVIVNNENFSASKDFSNRLGSDYDAKSLTDTFSRLGFEVMLENNLTSKRMAFLFSLVSTKYDHSNADCFVCVVLTHGDQAWLEREYSKTKERYDLLFGVDGNPIATKAVVEAFNDDNCPNLKGKPRMFFFQACRGTKLDDGTDIRIVRDQYTYSGTPVLSSTASSTVSVDGAGQLKSTHNMEETDSKPETFRDVENDQSDALPWSVMQNIPVSPAPLYKDCLVMYATPPGFLSWRRETGSWFIQSLCGVLGSSKMRSGNMSLSKALTRVSEIVGKEYESFCLEDLEMHRKKEIPVLYSMLVKDVFLKRKVLDQPQNMFFNNQTTSLK